MIVLWYLNEITKITKMVLKGLMPPGYAILIHSQIVFFEVFYTHFKVLKKKHFQKKVFLSRKIYFMFAKKNRRCSFYWGLSFSRTKNIISCYFPQMIHILFTDYRRSSTTILISDIFSVHHSVENERRRVGTSRKYRGDRRCS